MNSGLVYSLSAPITLTPIQLARNPGYARLPGGGAQTLFFGERGSQDYEPYGLLDFSATYTIPVWKTVRPWVKAEIYNVTLAGATGKIAFDAKGDRRDAEMTIFRMRGGKIVPVGIVKGGVLAPFGN